MINLSYKSLPLSLSLVFFVSGCADTARIERDVLRLKSSLAELRSFQADQTTQITGLRGQVQTLTGRVDEIEYSQRQKIGADLTNLKRDFSTLSRRIPPPAIVPVSALEQDEANAPSLPAPAASQLADALEKIREGNFPAAQSLLEEANQELRGGGWQPNIIFWIAVCHEGVGENKQALAVFNDLVTHFPKHYRAPLALLRVASIFVKVGDSRAASVTLKKVIADFPNTNEAIAAKEKLKSL